MFVIPIIEKMRSKDYAIDLESELLNKNCKILWSSKREIWRFQIDEYFLDNNYIMLNYLPIDIADYFYIYVSGKLITDYEGELSIGLPGVYKVLCTNEDFLLLDGEIRINNDLVELSKGKHEYELIGNKAILIDSNCAKYYNADNGKDEMDI